MEGRQHLSGACLDELVSEQVLRALEPAALELSLEAATHLEQERTELDQLWQKRLERSAFEAERAGRHYRLVEPENRLVARQLALEWETKLNVHQKLQEDYQRFTHQQPRLLTDAEQKMIRKLAENIPVLWNAKTTTQVQRKEIIRQVIRRIIVDVEGDSECVKLTIKWMGNSISKVELIRPVAKWTQLSNYPQLCQRLEQLVQSGATTEEITQSLNQEGFYPPKRRKTFNAEEVRALDRPFALAARSPYRFNSYSCCYRSMVHLLSVGRISGLERLIRDARAATATIANLRLSLALSIAIVQAEALRSVELARSA